MMTVSREELAAYADGELSAEREAAVAAQIAADPALARELEAHRALKARLASHFAPIVEEPLPEALTASLRSKEAEVVNFSAVRERMEAKRTLPRWGWIAGPALAASLALAVFLPRSGEPATGYADAQLAAVLDSQLVADQQPDATTRILLSFRNGDSDICRAFSGSEGGIACRDERGWKLEAIGEGSAGSGTDYRMAGAGDSELLAKVQDIASGPALDAEAERRARANGWR
jgi:hypothetical protein